ncbi:MAG: hypothetical protein MCM46_08945 [Candidatus Manganitrophus sp. SB1]|nr:hypothetical protein [Candidatus Manganitrophus morganii]
MARTLSAFAFLPRVGDGFLFEVIADAAFLNMVSPEFAEEFLFNEFNELKRAL